MPWLLQFINTIIEELPDGLNAKTLADTEEIEVVIVELDEQWSCVQNKKNQQWLWLVFHSATRHIEIKRNRLADYLSVLPSWIYYSRRKVDRAQKKPLVLSRG